MIDGGAGRSFINDLKLLHHYRDATPDFEAQSYTGHKIETTGYGYIYIDFDDNFLMIKCWYTPNNDNIICQGYLDEQECKLVTTNTEPLQYELHYNQRVLPVITDEYLKYITTDQLLKPKPLISINSIHSRLGHINAAYLLKSANKGSIVGVTESEISELKSYYTDHDCASCLLGKTRRAAAVEGSREPYLLNLPFNIVYTDICQITEHLQPSRERYIITFKCGITNFLRIYPLTQKSDAIECIKYFISWVERQFHEKSYAVKKMFSDQGSEYLSEEVLKFLAEHGIESLTTSTYTPASNGVAERVNLTILNDVRSMLLSSSLPSYFWIEAANYSVHIRNHIYSDKLRSSPAIAVGYAPLDVSKVHEFGEKCYIADLPYGSKTDPRGSTAIYLGFSPKTHGSIVFVPTVHGDLNAGRFLNTRHVTFTKKPELYFTSVYDKKFTNFTQTLHDNPLSLKIEDDINYNNNIENFIHYNPNEESKNNVIEQNEDHHHTNEVDIDMDEDDLEDEDYEFHFSLENDDLLDLAAVNENQLKEDVEFLMNDLLDFENKDEYELYKMIQDEQNTSTREQMKVKDKADDVLLKPIDELSSKTTIIGTQGVEDPMSESMSPIKQNAKGKESNLSNEFPKDNKSLISTKPSSNDIINSNTNSSQMNYGNSSNCASSNTKSESIINSKTTKVEADTPSTQPLDPITTDLSQKEVCSPKQTSLPPHRSNGKSSKPKVRPPTKGKNPVAKKINKSNENNKKLNLTKGSDVPVEESSVAKEIEPQNKTTTKSDYENVIINEPQVSPPLQENNTPIEVPSSSVAGRTRSRKKPIEIFDDRILGKTAKLTKDGNKKKIQVNKKILSRLEKDVSLLTKSNQPVPSEPIAQPTPAVIPEDNKNNTKVKKKFTSKEDKLEQLLYQKIPPKLKKDTPLRRSARLNAKNSKSTTRIHLILVNQITTSLPITPKKQFPKTYNAAIKSPDSKSWLSAIKNEFDSHEAQETWNTKPIIVSNKSPLLKDTIHTKWVFNIKPVEIFKARLVARGDLQSTNTYSETYSPTLRPEIARTILAQTCHFKWYFNQYDLKTAYLNSKLDEDIYIFPPSGYDTPKVDKNKRVIYKLQRGLYGLKQAGRLWHLEISNTLIKFGYEKHDAFPSTFIKKVKGKVVAIIGIFVDDMIVSTKNLKLMTELNQHLESLYKLKEITPDENNMQRFLGMNLQVTRTKDGRTNKITINQEEYIDSIIEEYNIEWNAKIKSALPPGYYFNVNLPENELFSSDEKALAKAKTEFKKQIGLLLYISVMTRPDITYAVNYLAQFCEYPHINLFKMINRMFQYLANTKSQSLEFKTQNNTQLEIYTDSDYSQDINSRRSMNAYLVQLYGNTVYWKSKYTALVCTSSAEAELQAVFIASNEAIWFRQLIVFLGMEKKDCVCQLRVDNMSIVHDLNKDNFSQASKHFAVRLHTVKERLTKPDPHDPFSDGNIRFKIDHISGDKQLADILTKPVTVKVINELIPAIF